MAIWSRASFVLSLGLSNRKPPRNFWNHRNGFFILAFLGGKLKISFLIPDVGLALIGAILAKRVEMTSMPELVAILHSFVGLAAVLVGMASFWIPVTRIWLVPKS